MCTEFLGGDPCRKCQTCAGTMSSGKIYLGFLQASPSKGTDVLLEDTFRNIQKAGTFDPRSSFPMIVSPKMRLRNPPDWRK